MIVAWDGRVSGTALRAVVKRRPRAATRSIDGVSVGPTRSARSVSIVTRSTFGAATADRAGAREQLVNNTPRISSDRFTVPNYLVRHHIGAGSRGLPNRDAVQMCRGTDEERLRRHTNRRERRSLEGVHGQTLA